jgi:DNA-binding PadR family transcriptional regulator
VSVRQSLLAILDQGPCYGYQLKSEFDRRTGSTWPLNVGQIYNTLEISGGSQCRRPG